jgi:pyruvate/2-oxoglutarate dehydrogenase complex dihydrolipoamide dehydrogenase (E3) component
MNFLNPVFRSTAPQTPVSYDDHRVLRENPLEEKSRLTTGRLIPCTIFIDHELGRIGMTVAEALDAGKSIKVAKLPMSSVVRASESAETRGFLKATVDTETDQILGAAMANTSTATMKTQSPSSGRPKPTTFWNRSHEHAPC